MSCLKQLQEKIRPSGNKNGEQLNEEDEEGEVFRLLSPKLLDRFNKMREERKKKIKEAESKEIKMMEKIVDGEIIYETETGDGENAGEEDDEFMFDDYDARDPQLAEGNQVPIKLGLIPKKIYQRPAIEIDSYINKTREVRIHHSTPFL
jgi:hypothetical protein